MASNANNRGTQQSTSIVRAGLKISGRSSRDGGQGEDLGGRQGEHQEAGEREGGTSNRGVDRGGVRGRTTSAIYGTVTVPTPYLHQTTAG